MFSTWLGLVACGLRHGLAAVGRYTYSSDFAIPAKLFGVFRHPIPLPELPSACSRGAPVALYHLDGECLQSSSTALASIRACLASRSGGVQMWLVGHGRNLGHRTLPCGYVELGGESYHSGGTLSLNVILGRKDEPETHKTAYFFLSFAKIGVRCGNDRSSKERRGFSASKALAHLLEAKNLSPINSRI